MKNSSLIAEDSLKFIFLSVHQLVNTLDNYFKKHTTSAIVVYALSFTAIAWLSHKINS